MINISGNWISESIEKYGDTYATRSFQITKDTWSVSFQTFADEKKNTPLFTIFVEGVYVIGGKSNIVENAHNAIFPVIYRSLTINSDFGVEMFAQMGVNVEKNKEISLLDEGCGFIPSLMNCMGEYDLVSLENGKCYFGDREGDLSKQRPSKLTPYAVIKK